MRRIFLILLLFLTPTLCFAQEVVDTSASDDEPVIVLTPDVANDTTDLKVYGPTTQQDHIWQLATKLRPDNTITTQQMMVALLKENPNAFQHGNVNGLKNGQMLTVPPLDKILEISPADAKTFVERQNTDWKKVSDDTSLVAATHFAEKLAQKKEKQKEAAVKKPVAAQPKPKPEIWVLQPSSPIAPIELVELPVPTKTVANTAAPAAASPKPTPVIATVPAAAATQALQNQLQTTEKQFQTYKTQMTNQVQKLEKQNISETKQITALKQKLAQFTQPRSNPWNALIPKTKVAWWIIWGALFLIALLWIPTPKRKVAARQEPVLKVIDNKANNDDLKNEYDFMNSENGIMAKLDLARAYIDMDDYTSAKRVLKEVMEKGNREEKQQAKQLLEVIKV